jgi:hypothetical protein
MPWRIFEPVFLAGFWAGDYIAQRVINARERK